MDKEDKPAFDARLKAIQALFLTEFEKVELAETSGRKQGKNTRKFGKLVIGKTTGYAARWLYRQLKVRLEN